MIKSELVQIIASRNLHLYQRDVEVLVDAIFDEIVAVLSDGGRAELRDFRCVHREAPPGASGTGPADG